MRQAFLPVLFLLLASTLVFPYTISGKVRGSGTNNPILAGTTVEIWDKGYIIASGVTDSFGKYSLEADAGTYLLVLKRTNYPDHIYSLPVSSDTERDAVMQKQPFIYGRVAFSSSLLGKDITLLKGGFVFAKSSLQDDGEFAFPPVPPGQYSVSVNFGDYSKTEAITVQEKASLKLDFPLEKTQVESQGHEQPGLQASASLSIPEKAEPGQEIEAVLLRGGLPVPGEKIGIQTPIGNVTQTTDGRGRVSITAIDYGVYRFSYGGLNYLVYVLPPEGQAQSQHESEPPSQGASAPGQEAPVLAKEDIAMVFFSAGFIIAIIAILGLLIFLFRHGRVRSHKAGHKKAKGESQAPFVPDQESQTTLANYQKKAHRKRR